MKKKEGDWCIQIRISISTSKWFTWQWQVAEFLGIKSTSKKAIASRCRQFGYEVNYY